MKKNLFWMTSCLIFWLHLSSLAYAFEKLSIVTEDGKFKVQFGIEFQPQYQFLSIENQGKTNTFQIRRGRVAFSGHAFEPEFTYVFQIEAVGGRTSNASPSVAFAGPRFLDAYVNYRVSDAFQIRFGQFKPFYNREEFTSSTKLQFVDLSLSNEVFTINRDLGVALHGMGSNKKWEYGVYAVNRGNNINSANPNKMFLIGGRLLYNILGNHGYTFGDYEHSEKPQMAVALASHVNKVGAPTRVDSWVTATTMDVVWRYLGWSLYGEGHFFRNHRVSQNTFGFVGEAGYFLVPKRFEMAGRFAGIVPTAAGVTNGYETGLAWNYYFYGHNLKLQADYNLLMNSALVLGVGGAAGTNGPTNVMNTGAAPGFRQNQNDHRFRLQLSFAL